MTDRHKNAKKAWVTMYRRMYPEMTDKEFIDWYEDQEYERMKADQRKKFRDLIGFYGFVYDTDFNEDIPIWAKRKTGQALDTMVISIQEEGYQAEDSKELLILLMENTG